MVDGAVGEVGQCVQPRAEVVPSQDPDLVQIQNLQTMVVIV